MRRRGDGPIPITEVYRGCPIHNYQPVERVENVVKPQIDRVLGLTAPSELHDIALDVTFSPEARLLAASLLEARHQIAADDRRVRPQGVDLDVVRAVVGCLSGEKWRSPWAYGSLLDVPPAPGQPGPVEREERLPED